MNRRPFSSCTFKTPKSSSDSENSRDCFENGDTKPDISINTSHVPSENACATQADSAVGESWLSVPSFKMLYSSAEPFKHADHNSLDGFNLVPQAIIEHSICPEYCNLNEKKEQIADIVAHLHSESDNSNLLNRDDKIKPDFSDSQRPAFKRSYTQDYNMSDDSAFSRDPVYQKQLYYSTLPIDSKLVDIDFTNNLGRFSQSSVTISTNDWQPEPDISPHSRVDFFPYYDRSELSRQSFDQGKTIKKLSFVEFNKSVKNKQSRSLDFNFNSYNLSDSETRFTERSIKESSSFEQSHVISVEMARDQHGSRLIQQRIESAKPDQISFIIDCLVEDREEFVILVSDVFGNYVIQKLIEFGDEYQRLSIIKKISGNILKLAVQMYGCRVVQKAIECGSDNLQSYIINEIRNHVLECIKDQNGNHVIQKCIEKINPFMLDFIIFEITGQVVELSTHPYGCRVIQRILEHFHTDQRKLIADELFIQIPTLILDQYGNYVVQHILDHCPYLGYREYIFDYVNKNLLELSSHKFASNVVEKCLISGSKEERVSLANVIINGSVGLESDTAYLMMRDAYANYVIQKLIDVIINDHEYELFNNFVSRIRPHMASLRRISYGKHIINKIEKLTIKSPTRTTGKVSTPSNGVLINGSFLKHQPSSRSSQDIGNDIKDMAINSVMCDSLTEFPSLIGGNEMSLSSAE